MIRGTGPGRGVPWWRWRRDLVRRWDPGFGREHSARVYGEHGRVVAIIGNVRTRHG